MRRKRFWIMAAVLALLLALMPPTHPAQADTYTVNSTNDVDDGTCNFTHCSLREAINAANNNAGADIIAFDITSGCDTVTGVCTIQLGSGLPWLTDDGTTIDGYSQDSVEPATDTMPATPKIEIDGANINSFIGGPGFVIVSAGNVISGVVINRFSRYGVRIYGSSATSNTISGNYIGTGASGTVDLGNGRYGVYIHGGAQNNTVGGDTASERNIISGNEWGGVYIAGIGTNGNKIWGNYIGTNISATGVLSNAQDGVFIGWGAQDNTIGVDTDGNGKGNVISGNGTTGNEWGGVSIYSTGTTSNTVSGNYIGTDASGTLDLGNVGYGVYIYDGAQNNTVGGTTTGERNIISGNGIAGVLIASDGTTGNRVSGNYIGTNISGTEVLSNAHGVLIGNGAQNNTVGGDMDGERNIISGNWWEGVRIQGIGTMSNTVSGNYIGTDADGMADLANGGRGVFITMGAQNNTVGGTTEGERNIISGNELSGVSIVDDDTTGNHVWGNYIGTNISGTGVLSNGRHGVFIGGGAYNTVGGDTDGNGKGNVISGNEWSGVWITGTETMSNTVSGNYIGTDAHGTAGLGNIWRGVFIGGGAKNNTVGGDMEGERNIISGNGGSGIVISGTGTIDNNVWGNYIGTNISGTEVLSNTNHGVYITDGAQNNPVGPDNVISGNDQFGVFISGNGTTGNHVWGNYIGTDASGTLDLGNGGFGVYIYDGAQNNTVGGKTTGERNVISGNNLPGVFISGSDTMSNTVSGNYIGTDAYGTADLGNAYDGIYIGDGAQNNPVGPGNVIAHNGWDGVNVDGSSTTGNTITQNSIFSNILGIDLTGGANGGIAAPVIVTTSFGSVNIVGTACAGCTVEVFENTDTDGEGETYIGDTTADASGAFTVTVSSLRHPYLTATATDAVSGTSEFSAVFTSTVTVGKVYLPIILKE